MKLKALFYMAAAAIIAVSCTNAHAGTYTVNLPLSQSYDGLMAYIVDYDKGQKLDSTLVSGGQAVFNGNVDEPILARIIVDGKRASQFVLEPGQITTETKGFGRGTENNDRIQSGLARMDEIAARYNNLPATATQADADAILAEYRALPLKLASENPNNPAGFFFFLQEAFDPDMTLSRLKSLLAQYPQWGETQKVKGVLANLEIVEETSEGHQYKDFEIEYQGKKQRLSDYVGKNGNYTLVDFWASWCGPCRKQIPLMKELYEKYHGKGLDVVGVAVWDEPANTVEAINAEQLPWNQIIDAQTIPTDLYGISGIPCIILIDPQGKIVSRGKQGDALRADVENALSTWNPADADDLE